MVVTTPKGFKNPSQAIRVRLFRLRVWFEHVSLHTFDRQSQTLETSVPGTNFPAIFSVERRLNKTNTTGWAGWTTIKVNLITGNLDAYHRELEVERTRKREKEKEELKRLREKVEEEKVLREVAEERKLREKEAEAFSSSSSSNGDEDTSEQEKELFEDGFYEKPGLSVERWRQTRDGETKELRRVSHD